MSLRRKNGSDVHAIGRPWFVRLSTAAVLAASAALLISTCEMAQASTLPRASADTGLFNKEIEVLTDRSIPRATALKAIATQDAANRAMLPSHLQATMGESYADVWLEPATAKIHVGETSKGGRKAAEAVVAQTGLSGSVTITPVRSTLAELLSAQKRWNRRHAQLFANFQAETGIESQHNAILIRLASSVPEAERQLILREAATAKVNMRVAVSSSASLMGTLTAETKCTKFSPPWVLNKADCEPSLASGVEILQPGEGKEICTAGPLAIPKAHKNRRLVLTAGHCVDKGLNPFEEKWEAFNFVGVPSLVGKPEDFSFGALTNGATYCGGLCTGGDYGDIPIGPLWRTGKANRPVYALTAEWGKGTEKSYPVTKEAVPMVGSMNCHEGRTSGEACGEITMRNVTEAFPRAGNKVVEEGLVEDSGANLKNEGGDSGGPWLSINGAGEASMEGINVGGVTQCVNVGKILKGEKFFKTQFECISASFYAEEAGNEGEWERVRYECVNVGKILKGAQFYPSAERCVKNERSGEGEWELKPKPLGAVWQPLTQPVAGAVEGPFTKLKLELLTTGNEKIKPRQQAKGGEPLIKKAFTSKSGASVLEATGGSISCSSDKDSGEATSTSEGTVNFTLTGCEGFSVKCQTGGMEGTIALEAKYTLVFVKEAESEELGVVLKFNETTIECGTTCPKMTHETVHLRGSAVGLATPVNKEVSISEVVKFAFSQSKGVQSPTEYFNEEDEKVSATLEMDGSGVKAFGFEQAGFADTDELTFEEAMELEGDPS